VFLGSKTNAGNGDLAIPFEQNSIFAQQGSPDPALGSEINAGGGDLAISFERYEFEQCEM
jgi:hypothetical protein